jgi:UDP-3-O-[3-hydroxymyristoyl] glucosamine N-acyltransferase
MIFEIGGERFTVSVKYGSLSIGDKVLFNGKSFVVVDKYLEIDSNASAAGAGGVFVITLEDN